MEKEAMYYHKREDGRVQCRLCPHNCVINQGKTGICGVRKNKEGTLYSLIYGEVSSVAMDPIEKKPLYHFYPGSSILSIGTVGCSFRCKFCQNYGISQNPQHPTDFYTSQELVDHALGKNSAGIAYTYSEPLIWYEFVLDTCRAVRKAGLKNVFVTNGYINHDPLVELLPYTDAFNIDLKSFNGDFYRKVVGGRLENVQQIIGEIAEHSEIMLEVTTLVIPGYNDSDEEMEKITGFLSSLNPDIPYHLSAYYPMYQFSAPPTPPQTLERLKRIAQKKLNYVYLGNVRGQSDTSCKNCGSVLIKRNGYFVRAVNYESGTCKRCGSKTSIIG